jgi:hypothetical protein
MADEAPDELKAMDIARRLGIRVPDVKRTIKAKLSIYIIMELDHGATLEKLWTRIDWVLTSRLAFQLRQFVHSMRNMTLPTAGSPLSAKCRSFWLDDYYGLPEHATPEAIKELGPQSALCAVHSYITSLYPS